MATERGSVESHEDAAQEADDEGIACGDFSDCAEYSSSAGDLGLHADGNNSGQCQICAFGKYENGFPLLAYAHVFFQVNLPGV